jgi:glutathione S-transferase
MITVYKFGSYWDVPDLSPFVVKVETWLRMAGLPYRTEPGDLRKAPKKKLPYIADGDRRVADSSAIIDYLKAKHGDKLDDGRFGPAERAVARAMKSLFEAELYFVIVYLRWWNDADFEIMKPALLASLEAGGVPRFLRPAVASMARRGTRAQVDGQGTGRHAREEVYALGRGLVEAAGDFLADKSFFMGERPSTLDATAYAFLSTLLWTPFDSPVRGAVQERPNLVSYCARMRGLAWKDGHAG